MMAKIAVKSIFGLCRCKGKGGASKKNENRAESVSSLGRVGDGGTLLKKHKKNKGERYSVQCSSWITSYSLGADDGSFLDYFLGKIFGAVLKLVTVWGLMTGLLK